MVKQMRVSWRTLLFFVLVWFIAYSFLSGFWPVVRSDGEWKTITNLQYGFSVDYPTKWNAQIYDESGFKGEDDVKLRIYRSFRDIFEISVEHKLASEPTLEEVIEWGNLQIDVSAANLARRGIEPNYELVNSEEMVIRGKTVFRERYSLGEAMYENIYLARENDMIIITLQAKETEFDNYLEDFNAIAASFRPLD
ncbi:hypothetical protein [Candidatus Leptofilum sp.]|uniref:hypothetical protein n=1 Tax=Candidatus Leptofilum sp. TaxID=3241576 RepID=UPI003B5B51AF